MKKFKISEEIKITLAFGLTAILILLIFSHIINVYIVKNDTSDYLEHEVLSCIQYVSINVDENGDVLNEDICYAFTYKDDDDQLLHVTEYTEDEYTTVHIGEENKFVVYDNGDTKLYLTREVLGEFFYTKESEFEI